MPEYTTLTIHRRKVDSAWLDDIDSGRRSTRDANSPQELDRRLDQALEETFPASDPISIIICQ